VEHCASQQNRPRKNFDAARAYGAGRHHYYGGREVRFHAAEPKLATRTWQAVMENIVARKTDETRRRWDVAIQRVRRQTPLLSSRTVRQQAA
jgi:hypothetical protein